MNDQRDPQSAAEWLVALQERPDDPELAARFEAWRAAAPENARAWAEISRTYDLLGRVEPAHREAWDDPATAGRLAHADPAGPPVERGSGRRSRRRRVLAGMAAAAAVALAVVALRPTAPSGADYATGTAEMRRVALADGSVVRLAPESAIAVDYAETRRRVTLLDGIAYFGVRRDPDRPFRVDAGGVGTSVLGTAFEVRRTDKTRAVAVREGRVAVAGAADGPALSARLTAGQWVRVAGDGTVTRGRRPPERIAAWREGRLIAKDRPVAEVVAALRRYYPGLVLMRGEALAAQPLTGVYSLSDPAAALRAIAAAQDARVIDLSPLALVIAGR